MVVLGKWSRRSVLRALLVALVLLLAIPQAAWADNGDGTGPSEGSPGAKPLSFVSASLVEGGASIIDSEDVPLKAKMRLLFDKNIVNSTVWGINRECFTLMDAKGASVPIEVTKIDDTINFDQRQAVFVEPVDPLKSGASYSLKVAPQLKAKNGVSTLGGTTSGRGVTIVFKTAGTAAGASGSEAAKSPGTAASGAKPVASAPAAKVQTGAKPAASTSGGANAAGATGSAKPGAAPASAKPSVTPGDAKPSATPGARPESSASPAASATAGPTAAQAEGVSPAASAAASPAPGGSASPAQPAASSPADAGEEGAAAAAQPSAPGLESAASAAPAAAGVAAATDLGDSADPHWRMMMIIAGVLLVGWALAEVLYFRKRRRKRE
ncbi:hypothetical protein J2Z22_004654 [Paenibacillus forsythiae]|uniref:SbsA Ig-like domain-containing protein n=2 Tax=Paenibacillus forsythiae TaxID=365616 RepID=A0ABU3HE15_9BACL|nr:hypothetical protein [Paenibacillus forsythiae]MDT3429055.1 hypothetical protein [Paenibacillus forsythiae]